MGYSCVLCRCLGCVNDLLSFCARIVRYKAVINSLLITRSSSIEQIVPLERAKVEHIQAPSFYGSFLNIALCYSSFQVAVASMSSTDGRNFFQKIESNEINSDAIPTL